MQTLTPQLGPAAPKTISGSSLSKSHSEMTTKMHRRTLLQLQPLLSPGLTLPATFGPASQLNASQLNATVSFTGQGPQLGTSGPQRPHSHSPSLHWTWSTLLPGVTLSSPHPHRDGKDQVSAQNTQARGGQSLVMGKSTGFMGPTATTRGYLETVTRDSRGR